MATSVTDNCEGRLQDLYDRTGYRPVTPDLLSVVWDVQSQHIIDNRELTDTYAPSP